MTRRSIRRDTDSAKPPSGMTPEEWAEVQQREPLRETAYDDGGSEGTPWRAIACVLGIAALLADAGWAAYSINDLEEIKAVPELGISGGKSAIAVASISAEASLVAIVIIGIAICIYIGTRAGE